MTQIPDLPQPSFESIARALGEKDIMILRLTTLVERLQRELDELSAPHILDAPPVDGG